MRRHEGAPIVDTCVIDTRGQKIGQAGQAKRGHQSAVTASPNADASWIHVGATPKIVGGALDVVQLAGSRPCELLRRAKIQSVPRASAIVHGEHHITLTGKILIHPVHVAVRIHRMPAEEHLSGGPAMEEEHRGPTLAVLRSRCEELAMYVESVRT